MTTYTSGAVAKLFSVSRETIRQWTKQFSDHLSDSATPGEGVHRQYTDDDLRVLGYVVQARQIGKQDDTIHADLAAGSRADPAGDITNIMFAATGTSQIVALKTQVAMLNDQLKVAKADNVRHAAQIDLLQQQLRDAQKRIDQLNREIGRLEGPAGGSG